MSLAIDLDDVTAVWLRGHDEWFPVAFDDGGKSTFIVDAFEFTWGDLSSDTFQLLANMGNITEGHSTGFSWRAPDWPDERIVAAAADVLAVRHRVPK
jgi:hypothetical protein